LQPMEWLQYIADSFSSLADLWDEYDTNFFENEFEDYKNESPQSTKKEMYEYIAWERISGEGLIHAYLYDCMDIANEIEHLRGNIVKAFEGCVIFPNLLNAIGIIESVMHLGESSQEDFLYYQYYCVFSSPEEVSEIYGEKAAKRFNKEVELTEDDYESAFECITELLEKLEKDRYSEKLRESAWAIKGYCKLKVGSKKYAETEAQIAKRHEIAYQSYQYAEKKIDEPVTDKRAYEYLNEHGMEGGKDLELPCFETWQRYVRAGRKHYGTQKNTLRAGRTHGRSAITPDQIQSLSEITSQYTEEDT
ncbi:unnamed protein product, partial [marine sediment metagenome]